MRWRLCVIGKPKLAFAEMGVSEYARRLGHFVKLEIVYGKATTREQESAWLLAKSEGMLRVALDERGRVFSSRELATTISDWEMRATREVAILIGGADGHAEELRKSADAVWSLSALTLQHELALVVLLEQLYRAYAINHGLPYHRD